MKIFRNSNYWNSGTLLLMMIITVKAQADQITEIMQNRLDQQQAEIESLQSELELLKNKEDQPAIHEGSSRDAASFTCAAP